MAIPSRREPASRGPAARGPKRPVRKATTRPPARRAAPKARPIGDRPRVRSTNVALVKKSDRPAKRGGSADDRITKRPTRSANPRVSLGRPTRTPVPRRTSAPARSSSSPRLSSPHKILTPRVSKPLAPLKLAKRVIEKKATEKKAAPEMFQTGETLATVRLNKFIANAGITSRRKADELITKGAVTINGKVVSELGVQVKPYEDQVTVNGETITMRPRLVYLLLNKPKDTITTTSDEKDRTTVLDYVQTNERVYPVGRLDRNTTGVLLLTNDGELTNRLTHPSFEIEREYHVTLDKRLEREDAKKIAAGGIDIGDGDVTGPAELAVMEIPKEILLKITEGKNREVRRIFETLGYEVEKLDRISFAGLTHRGMGRGESRQLTLPEIHRLKKTAGIEL